MIRDIFLRGIIFLFILGVGVFIGFVYAYLAEFVVGSWRTLKLGRSVVREIGVPSRKKIREEDIGRYYYSRIFLRDYRPRAIHNSALIIGSLGMLFLFVFIPICIIGGIVPEGFVLRFSIFNLFFIIPTSLIIGRFGQSFSPTRFFYFEELFNREIKPGKNILSFLLLLAVYAGLLILFLSLFSG